MGGHPPVMRDINWPPRDDQVPKRLRRAKSITVDRVLVSGCGGESPGFIGLPGPCGEPLTDGYILHTGISPSSSRSVEAKVAILTTSPVPHPDLVLLLLRGPKNRLVFGRQTE